MKITGSMHYVKFDLENGYMIKAEGEMLAGRQFVAYKNTMKSWEEPHQNEEVTQIQIEKIIQEVKNTLNEKPLQIIFK